MSFFKKDVSLGKECGQELICLTGFLEGSVHKFSMRHLLISSIQKEWDNLG